MNSKYKSIISLGLVSLLTACGSESSLSLSEGLIQGNNIRAQQMSTEFVAPQAFSIERTVEEVTPTKITQIKQIWQNVIAEKKSRSMNFIVNEALIYYTNKFKRKKK